jgi:hypothetical protein
LNKKRADEIEFLRAEGTQQLEENNLPKSTFPAEVKKNKVTLSGTF